MSGWLTTSLLGLLLCAVTGRDGVARVRGLLGPAREDRRAVVLGHAAGSLGLLLIALPAAVVLAAIPSALVGYYGILPLLRGMGQLGDVRFVRAEDPPLRRPASAGALGGQAAARAIRQGVDALIGLVALFAISTAIEVALLAILFGLQVALAAGLALRAGSVPGMRGSDPADRLGPLLLMVLGAVVLLGSGTLNWLLPAWARRWP